MADTTTSGMASLPGWAECLAEQLAHPYDKGTLSVEVPTDAIGATVHPRHSRFQEWFSAVLTVCGVAVDRSCPHRHGTAEAAVKCQRRVLREALELIADPTFRAVAVNHGVMAWLHGPTVYDRRSGITGPKFTDMVVEWDQ